MIRNIDTKDRRVDAQYLVDGVLVTICKPGKVRKSERTWKAVRGSVANLGGKAVALRGIGFNHAKG